MLLLDLAILKGCRAELTQLAAWLHTDVVLVYPPIPVVTEPDVDATNVVKHKLHGSNFLVSSS